MKEQSILIIFDTANGPPTAPHRLQTDYRLPKMHRGKLLTLLILLAAVAVAGFAVWFHHQQSSRVLQSLSPNTAALIAYAPQIELLRLAAEKDAGGAAPLEILRLQGHSYYVTERKDITQAKNVRTVRGWLVHNDNYDWTAPAGDSKGPWQHALVFTQGAQQATTLLFDHVHAQMLLPDTGQVLSTSPMNAGLKEFFDSQFAVERN
jgi:hypothetical protein